MRTDSVSIIFKKNYVDIQNSIPLRLKTTESWMLFQSFNKMAVLPSENMEDDIYG